MKRRSRKPRFVTSSIADFKSRAALVIEDGLITDAEKKVLLNRLRREVMSEYSFYSREREEIDHFIRGQLEKREGASKSVTEVV